MVGELPLAPPCLTGARCCCSWCSAAGPVASSRRYARSPAQRASLRPVLRAARRNCLQGDIGSSQMGCPPRRECDLGISAAVNALDSASIFCGTTVLESAC